MREAASWVVPDEAEAFIQQHKDQAFDLLKTIARIPSPSNHEEERARFVKTWLEGKGCTGVYIDDALNVVYPVGDQGDNPLSVFMAHTDVVFPDTTPLPVTVEGGMIKAPGIGDDTANLVALLLCAWYVTENKLRPRNGEGVLFVANAGEEGLGNLKGSRKICATYRTRLSQVISFDGTYKGIVNKAVGSLRMEVTVRTEGGHSYADFGNKNAIAYLARMITTLYQVEVPHTGRTTYNVGLISGGTSVNTIAQEARMAYEFRSDERADLSTMQQRFQTVIQEFRGQGVSVEVKPLGERPCSGDVDAARLDALVQLARAAIARESGTSPRILPGSTDCNIPLSLGIPSICFGCYLGGGAHTYQEWVEVASLHSGYRIALSAVLSRF